jgi:predicted nucleotidyltransferase component of viral defense system
MLQTKSVEPKLLELLNFLMEEELFKEYVLVGGTALALQIGHRKSTDLDLFGKSEISHDDFLQALAHAGRVQTLKKSKNMLIVTLNDIKVDFVNYTYPLIYPVVSVGNIRLASIQDIAAMKLNAIAGRGVKKDFIDVYYLLKQFTFKELIDFYLNKYPDGSEFIVRKSMVYFDDADSESTPIIFDGTGWEQVKEEIIKHVM